MWEKDTKIYSSSQWEVIIEERKSYDYEHLKEEKRIEILPVSLLTCWAIAATQKFWLSSKS